MYLFRHARLPGLCSIAAAMALAWGQAPAAVTDIVLLTTNSIHIEKDSEIVSGDLLVNEISPGPTLSGGAELVIEKNVKAADTSLLQADTVVVKKDAELLGTVQANELSNAGEIGTEIDGLLLPVFAELPLFLSDSPAPGAPNVNVPKEQSLTLAAGDYGSVVTNKEVTLRFTGGTYRMQSLNLGKENQVLFQAPSVVIVQDSVGAEGSLLLGPEPGAGVSPPSILFYVAGSNAGSILDDPFAVDFDKDSTVAANFYAPNGTVELAKDSEFTGAVIARDVLVQKNVKLNLASGFFTQLAPEAEDDAYSVEAGGILDSAASGLSVLDNDFDPNSIDTLTVANTPTRPNFGSVSMHPDGTFIYTHDGGLNPADAFTYEVCDDGLPVLCSQAQVQISLTGVGSDLPPTAAPQTLQTNGASPLSIVLTGSDPEGQDLVFAIVSAPSQGALGAITPIVPPLVTDPETGDTAQPPITSANVTYTPPAGAGVVDDGFVFSVTDPGGNEGMASVDINPAPEVEVPPNPVDTVVANGQEVEALAGGSADILLRGEAPDGVDLGFSITNAPQNGQLSGLTPGAGSPVRTASVNYEPSPGFAGSDGFSFEACGSIDGVQVCDQANVSIQVIAAQALAFGQTVLTPLDTSVPITLEGEPGLSFGASIPGGGVVAFEIGVGVAGNVADSDGDFQGDNHSPLPGPIPVLMAAAINSTGGPGLEGTVRIQMEWDIFNLVDIADRLESAEVLLHTEKGSLDTLDTVFFQGGNGDGQLVDLDYQFVLNCTAALGSVMPVPDVADGTQGTFSFDILTEVQSVLEGGNLGRLGIQGCAIGSGTELQRGLQVRTSADSNLTASLEPKLMLTASAVAVQPLVYSITSLPDQGTLKDGTGASITSVPAVLPSNGVVYTPAPGYVGADDFQFGVDDPNTGTSATATVSLFVQTAVGAGDCSAGSIFCDQGR